MQINNTVCIRLNTCFLVNRLWMDVCFLASCLLLCKQRHAFSSRGKLQLNQGILLNGHDRACETCFCLFISISLYCWYSHVLSGEFLHLLVLNKISVSFCDFGFPGSPCLLINLWCFIQSQRIAVFFTYY